jgi:hypothetical protein
MSLLEQKEVIAQRRKDAKVFLFAPPRLCESKRIISRKGTKPPRGFSLCAFASLRAKQTKSLNLLSVFRPAVGRL